MKIKKGTSVARCASDMLQMLMLHRHKTISTFSWEQPWEL